jgi:hypothetical protein
MSPLGRRRFLVASLALPGMAAVAGVPPHEQSRIERLIRFVESQKGIRFIRNGSEYTCEEAARFLRGKLETMGERVTTARDFIEHVGSRSSTTGQPYRVRLADGRMLPAAQFLGEELQRIEGQPA